MWKEFADKHNIAATEEDVARLKRGLSGFYAAVESINHPSAGGYIQLHHGQKIRNALNREMGDQLASTVAMVLDEMPSHWPPKFKASVAYHLSPLLADVINS